MAMSDPLAEALMAEYSAHRPWGRTRNGKREHSCSKEGCDWHAPVDSWATFQDHRMEALAKAARAFIATEICDVQICEERDPSENAADLTYLDGLDHARRIAWGMAGD